MPTVDSTPPTQTSDPELEERARGGDQAARTRLLDYSRDDLTRFCYRYVGNVHEAEDAAQDVLVALTEREGWPQGSFRAWLFRIARNRCLDLIKHRRGGRAGIGSYLGDSQLPSPRTGPRTAAMRHEEQEALRQQLALLSPDQAEVLVLRYFEGLSHKEIAEVLEVAESVVRSRLFTGGRELRRRTEKKKGTP